MIETLETEVVDFVYDSYPAIHGKVTKEQVERLLRIYNDKVIIVRELGEIKGVGFYYKLSNRTYQDVKDRVLDIGIPQNAQYCLRENGRNIHFVFVVTKGVQVLLRGLREVIRRENPKTISWFSPDMKDFFERRL